MVDEIRLWCFENGLEAYKAEDLPNIGRFVNEKVREIADRADYYIVVLPSDEELASGGFHPRQNAVIEMVGAWERDPTKVCVLKDEQVEMPSDYSNLITEPLEHWRTVLLRELRAVMTFPQKLYHR